MMEIPKLRKVNPFLAFLAGFFGFGMGYVYVGRLRTGVMAFIGFYVLMGFFAWTRLVLYSATIWWTVCACSVLWVGRGGSGN
jgi:hypothetical protein